ncbi:ATP-dependent helicase [Planctomicrobium piriforme]|uniref:DNA 3'-5' helicase n=1 Tax=Planctomicrobium piriforme TaxID=1576369 RepID=A0A1I3J544_9PLAN|nr:UvrD-helicase domain-containing protein [Planctomicrobium piriforme]SFI55216.1 DNA helicase-2 / ATP-dependent DNA helicase PcrA [Planctomicrobium piriforme]
MDLSKLNAAQREAVETLQGPVLVLAGAGTGKTRVITYRMARLLRAGVQADRILSVTFTNKAAKEMLERTKALIGASLKKRPWISTFHSLCVQVLREDISRLGYPPLFAILDRGDQESMARKVLRDIRVTEKSLKPGDLLSLIGKWKSAGLNPERAATIAEDDKESLGAMAYRRYQLALKASGSVDFDDLLLLTEQLFDTCPDVLKKNQQRFSHVQIDEYQDTNGLQFRIIESLVREHHNLCVVGDDDQSIYGWRGAEVKHILGFARTFPGAKVVRLEENYRCTDRIIDHANRLVSHNRDRHKKVLRAHKPAKEEVRFIEYPDEQLEAEKVVGEIRFLHQKKGLPLVQFAILFRTNEQPRLFESELRRQQLPYVLMGSQSFYDRKEIKDLLSYLKVIGRPDDEQSLLRIINTPARGISDAACEKLLARAVKVGVPIWNVVEPALVEKEITQKAADALRKLHGQFRRWREQFQQHPEKMDQLLRTLIEEIDYDREIERQYKDEQQQAQRKVVLQDYVNSLAEYVEKASPPTLHDYLSSIALERRDEEPDKEAMAQSDAVKLMTLHSAKGLEFPRVYMVGMEEGLLPHKRTIEGTEAEIAEERRLCYVGVTRAQESLTLTRAASRRKWGKPRPSQPSRFIMEMRGETKPNG